MSDSVSEFLAGLEMIAAALAGDLKNIQFNDPEGNEYRGMSVAELGDELSFYVDSGDENSRGYAFSLSAGEVVRLRDFLNEFLDS